jgi:O-antigen/teichoic acid export membrane protein
LFQKLKELLKDTVTYGATGVLEALLAFFLLPLYTRYFRPEDYGTTTPSPTRSTVASR